MGNRANITTKHKDIAVYVHWNGGKESIDTFLCYCYAQGYRKPEEDDYGYARLVQVIANFFGGGNSVGISKYDSRCDSEWDNGTWIIENWHVIDQEFIDKKRIKTRKNKTPFYELIDYMREVNSAMPVASQLSDSEIEAKTKEWISEEGKINA